MFVTREYINKQTKRKTKFINSVVKENNSKLYAIKVSLLLDKSLSQPKKVKETAQVLPT